MKEGGSNMKFFPKMASCRKKINTTNRLRVEEEEIRDKMEDFYTNLLMQTAKRGSCMIHHI